MFSKMKHSKGKYRGQLSDHHLIGQLRVACSSMKAHDSKLCKDLQHQAVN